VATLTGGRTGRSTLPPCDTPGGFHPAPDALARAAAEAAWRSVGVSLPHNALEQKYATPRVAVGDLRPGDLVFYYSDVHHVVIYVGNGWVVSAPTFGIPVEMQKIDMSRYNSAGRPG